MNTITSRRFPSGATIFVVVAMLFGAQTQEKAAKYAIKLCKPELSHYSFCFYNFKQ